MDLMGKAVLCTDGNLHGRPLRNSFSSFLGNSNHLAEGTLPPLPTILQKIQAHVNHGHYSHDCASCIPSRIGRTQSCPALMGEVDRRKQHFQQLPLQLFLFYPNYLHPYRVPDGHACLWICTLLKIKGTLEKIASSWSREQGVALLS